MNYSNSQRVGVILYLTALIFGVYDAISQAASHRLCGKGWTNHINIRHNHPSRIKPVSDNRNVGFHIAGIVVSANKNIHAWGRMGVSMKHRLPRRKSSNEIRDKAL